MQKILLSLLLTMCSFSAFSLTEGQDATFKKNTFYCDSPSNFYRMTAALKGDEDDQQTAVNLVRNGNCHLVKRAKTVTIFMLDDENLASFTTSGGSGGWAAKSFFEE